MRISRRRRIDRRGRGVDSDRVPSLSDAIAANVRAERARRRWKQEELASRAGMSRTTVGDIEAGKRKVTADYLPGLCRALDVPLATLVAGADPEDLRALGL
ncbi:MAG TPA: helix-turn-helix transcriptional regulator [Kineosporiaceae bacterium]|nr:helix-turn-helix transcriptional regulator [Kineosporiaceae bacterium]